ncbi:AraC family transcriptional regulator [Kaistia nematophila]|uniref:AraC family transcriptional regulator ligand-binding domain-containing protein n=1 Tax=Kaistia nematophila TaxID=2994654 RepID=A0A9X3DXU7_9HYPH|nr:AraC family transcriptional regulator [Kaistia nematophila]MCX5567732.1 AraC family transcriptional regulator ligand-binding domain-containing protein [Kaistia nematophila]
MWDRSPVKLSLLHMVPAVAAKSDILVPDLLGRAGLAADALSMRGAVATRSQICTLLNIFARRSGEATLGLDLAAAADPLQLGLSGQALIGGRTIRECLAAHARQMPTLQGGVELSLAVSEGRAYWRHSLLNSDALHASVLNEGIAAFVVSALRSLAGTSLDLHIALPHRARAPIRSYEDKLAADVSFGAGAGITISFSATWLDQPSHLFATTIPEAADQSAFDTLPMWQDDRQLEAALARIFASAALVGALSLVDAARSLGISPRSLQRRLASCGTSFEEQTEVWRRNLAQQFLAASGMEIGAIARALGYSDPSHFIRAFRRWHGVTPLAYRRSALARNGN